MPDTDTKDPTDQVGSYEDDLAQRSTSDEEEEAGKESSQEESQQDENSRSSKRPSLGQLRKLSKGFNGPSGAGSAEAAGAAGEGAAAGAGGAVFGAGAGGAAAGAGAGGAAVGTAVASSPVGWIIGGVVFVLIIIIVVIISATGAGALQNGELKITKTGPAAASLNDPLPYQIDVSYPGTATDIVIQDQIPSGTDYVDSVPTAKFDPASRTATWNLKDFVASQGGVLSSPSASLKINLKATADNSVLVNQAQGEVIGAGAAPNFPTGGGNVPVAGDYIPPNNNTCNGNYVLSTSIGNFGDPSCNFDKNTLYDMLTKQDPDNADTWFFRIVPCESGYVPNAYAPPSTGTPDAQGAWGLFQMGSSTPPGQAPPATGKNGPNDRGDVNWPIQTSNATSYGKLIGGDLEAYWDGARDYNRTKCWVK